MKVKFYQWTVLLFALAALSFRMPAQTEKITFAWEADGVSTKSFYLWATDGEGFTVDWGDGTVEPRVGEDNLMQVEYTANYSSAGSYTVVVEADDANGVFTWLIVDEGGLTALDLSAAPSLTHLGCSNNENTSGNNSFLAGLNLSLNPDIKRLLLHGNSLGSLPGLTACAALSLLWCDDNALTALNLSANAALTDLRCNDNLLTALDVGNSPDLLRLWCSNNGIGALALSNNADLEFLYCYENDLGDLDLVATPDLQYLYCYGNPLGALDVGDVPDLLHLWCSDNDLDDLDLSANPDIEMLYCYDNQLLLSTLYAIQADIPLAAQSNKRLGPQDLGTILAIVGDTLTFGAVAQNIFGGVDTDFLVKEGGITLTPGVEYDVFDGEIFFLAPGDYYVEMFNVVILSDGTYPAVDIFRAIVERAAVDLELRVFLEGVVKPGPVMTNYIQAPDGYINSVFSTSKLPLTDPYGIGVTCPDVRDTLGAAGKVVDWIQVMVAENFDIGASPPTIDTLEIRALLLKPDGSVVDIDGGIPRFTPHAGPVTIVVQHRSHLAAVSHLVADFSVDVAYDFSTAGQALSAGPPPMVFKEGVYCMWVGDVDNNEFIEAGDIALIRKDMITLLFDQYINTDLNMDGITDNVDAAIMEAHSTSVLYSPMFFFAL